MTYQFEDDFMLNSKNALISVVLPNEKISFTFLKDYLYYILQKVLL
jgi:hypothetical protein